MDDGKRELSSYEVRKKMLEEEEKRECEYRDRERTEEEIIKMCELAVECFQSGNKYSTMVGGVTVGGIDEIINKQYVQANKALPQELKQRILGVSLLACLNSYAAIKLPEEAEKQ
jgi:hypothetical protein